MLLGLKFNVPSRGELGKNLIWRIYKNLDKGHAETVYCEHLEIEDVDSWSGEDLYRIGYSLILEGEVETYIDEETGLKFARIFGSEE